MGMFEQLGPLYDWFLAPVEAWRLRAWRRQLVGDVRGRVLDVGVGTGLNLPHYPPDTEVVALDLTWEMLRYAIPRRRANQLLVQGDVQALPFPDASFDAVVGALVFCSVPDAVQGLREVRRVLKPHGRLRLLEHVRGSHPVARALTDLFEPAWYRMNGSCHLNRDTPSLVVQAGFEIVEQRTFAGSLVVLLEARPR